MNTSLKQGVSITALLLTSMTMTHTASADDFTLNVGGRVQIDYAIADADIAGTDWSASELRRARLNVSGNFGKNLKYKFELNTNSSEDVNIEDAYVQWTPTAGKWNVKAGQFKTPNSLDEQTSSRFISTLERASFTDAFEFNRRIGAAVNTSGKTYTFSAGVFGDNLSNISDQESIAIAARGTFNPLKTDEALVHLGASFRYRDQGETQGDIRYRQRPFTHIPGRIISTGSIAQSDTFFGAEAAGIFNNFWVSGEYGVTNASCGACAEDPSLSGGYAEAGLFFGGKKTYKSGKFNRPKVDKPITDGGMGAVSMVVRYDTIDLADTSVNGGDMDTFILGADWWPTKNTRVGLNYFNSDAKLGTSTSGLDSDFATLVTNGVTEESVSGVVARLQFDF
jgi:phosphate-selective porin OprO/OprP